MDFLNQGQGDGFLSGFPPFSLTVYSMNSRNCKKLCEFEMKSQGNDVEATVNSKEKNT